MTSQTHIALPFALPCGKKQPSSMAAAVQSDYFHTLDLDTKKRYLAKTSLIGGVDPYALKQQDLSHAVDLLPLLRYIAK